MPVGDKTMVNETLEQETLEAVEDVEVPTDGFDPAEAPEDVVEGEAQPDIAELVERLSQIEGAAKELDTLKHDVSSQLGRIQLTNFLRTMPALFYRLALNNLRKVIMRCRN